MAKHHVIKANLAKNNNEATFEQLFAVAEELHCDVLTAALASMKRKKVIGYDKEMPLLHPNEIAVVIKQLKPDFDCFQYCRSAKQKESEMQHARADGGCWMALGGAPRIKKSCSCGLGYGHGPTVITPYTNDTIT